MATMLIIQGPNINAEIVQKIADSLKVMGDAKPLGGVFKQPNGDTYYWNGYQPSKVKGAP